MKWKFIAYRSLLKSDILLSIYKLAIFNAELMALPKIMAGGSRICIED